MASKKSYPVWVVLSLWGSLLFVAFLLAENLSEALRRFQATELLLSCFVVAGGLWWILNGKKKGKGKTKRRTSKRRAALPKAGQAWKRSEEIFQDRQN